MNKTLLVILIRIFNFDSQIGEVKAVHTFEKYLSKILKEVT